MRQLPLHYFANLAPIPVDNRNLFPENIELARRVKFPGPPPFKGERDLVKVRTFIMGMNAWLSQLGISVDSPSSFSVAQCKLLDQAMLWFYTIQNTIQPPCWAVLAEEIAAQFIPANAQALASQELYNMTYKMTQTITEFNNEFLRILSLTKEYMDASAQSLLGLYFAAITRQKNATGQYLMAQYQITSRIDSSLTTLRNVMAFFAELDTIRRANRPTVTPFRPQRSFGRPSNRVSQSVYRGQRLNNIQTPAESDQTADNDEYFDNQYGIEDDTQPAGNPEDNGEQPGSDSESDGADADIASLNAMSRYRNRQRKRFGKRTDPKLMEERRNKNQCFHCGKEGHYANKCPNKTDEERKTRPSGFKPPQSN
jgi:hypothetical protein